MGKFFPLQITDVPTCALFPGQVVAIEGRNPTGGKIIAENIFTDVKLPEWNAPTQFLEPRGWFLLRQKICLFYPTAKMGGEGEKQKKFPLDQERHFSRKLVPAFLNLIFSVVDMK